MKEYFLTAPEQRHLAYVVSRAVSGLYRIRDLLGEAVWGSIESKTSYGRRVKRSVAAGQISGIAVYSRTIQNHRVYLVTNPAARQA